jgi:hypothetical protein
MAGFETGTRFKRNHFKLKAYAVVYRLVKGSPYEIARTIILIYFYSYLLGA